MKRGKREKGQAIAEFTVSLIAILFVFLGVLAISVLSMENVSCLIAARGEADVASALGTSVGGVSPEPILELDIATLNAMEGTIYSVYRYRNLWSKTISAVASGAIPVANIVSHKFDFKDCIEAVDYSLKHKDEVIKGVIKM